MIAHIRNADCTRCPLHATAKTVCVMGNGDPASKIMVIGEAPGENEDVQGEPFVGKAGKFLNEELAAVGIRREDVYVTNMVKCRPPGNRRPEPEELGACLPYLVQEVRAVRPDFILLLGNTPLKTLTDVKLGVTKARGRVPTDKHVFGSPIVYVTLHPSAAMRQLSWKTAFQADLRAFASLIEVRTQQLAASAT